MAAEFKVTHPDIDFTWGNDYDFQIGHYENLVGLGRMNNVTGVGFSTYTNDSKNSEFRASYVTQEFEDYGFRDYNPKVGTVQKYDNNGSWDANEYYNMFMEYYNAVNQKLKEAKDTFDNAKAVADEKAEVLAKAQAELDNANGELSELTAIRDKAQKEYDEAVKSLNEAQSYLDKFSDENVAKYKENLDKATSNLDKAKETKELANKTLESAKANKDKADEPTEEKKASPAAVVAGVVGGTGVVGFGIYEALKARSLRAAKGLKDINNTKK